MDHKFRFCNLLLSQYYFLIISYLLGYIRYAPIYRVIQNDCRGFNNLSYTIHLRQKYIFAPMDQEILKVFFYDLRCAVVMHFSAWSAVY